MEKGQAPSVTSTSPHAAGIYKIADFSGFHAIVSPDRFHEVGYEATLIDLIAHVIQHESPISEDLLVHRISRAHGFQKSGSRIRDRVIRLAEQNHFAEEEIAGNRFFWQDNSSPFRWNKYRPPSSADDFRSIEEICRAELRAARASCKGSDVSLEVARIFGTLRLTTATRSHLDSILADDLPVQEPDV